MNFTARDHVALSQFWAEALPEVSTDFTAAPNPETVNGRVHLDLATTSAEHQAELVARLKELGATDADIGQGDVPWTVLADPEGNRFCVLEPRAVYQDTGPIAAVVVNCADPRAMAEFWGPATEWAVHEVDDDFARLRAEEGPYLEFLRTPDVDSLRNHIHLDFVPHPHGHEADVLRLTN
ncbi:VOC family protein [Allokutzneria sp. NRRL B-24872]|uniref:VOC family protein n=1 Tax=Allokutzneria sp. NRRL B-24872 TaxID=1137961 RepID=UPI001FEEFDDB|nr:VOC family protein [Allokutzneria sp. NRRL B-24872]